MVGDRRGTSSSSTPERYASFVQSLEERFYGPGEPERMAAALALDLPVRFVTEARWIAARWSGCSPAAARC